MARRQDGSEEVRRQNRKRAPRPRRRSRHPRSAANGAHQEEGDAGRRLSEVTEISVAEPGSRRKVASPPSRSLRSAIAIPSSLPKNPKSSMTVQIVPSPFLPPSASRAHARVLVAKAQVAELTDDKGLLKQERKDRQIAAASHKSEGASVIKLADKTSNLL